jgi:hypothetical protein
VTLKTPWRDGTTELTFSRLELMERLASLIPPPKINQIAYLGVLGARSSWRRAVVPRPRAGPKWTESERLVPADEASEHSRWVPWAPLLRRVFGAEGWICSNCGQRMKLHAVVKGPPASTRILAGLAAASRGPPMLATG